MKKKTKRKIQNLISNIDFKEILFLFLVFLISFIIRRIGLKYGFPLLTHPDEGFSLDPVYYMTKNKTLNSNTYNRPDQILLTINFIYLNVASYIQFGKSMANTYMENKLFFYYFGRLLICFLGSIIPIIAYKIGKEFKLNFAIPAALLFAFFPSYVIHSHYIAPDIPITLLSLLVILFTVKYLNTQKLFYLYIATIIVAINTAEKYPGILSLSIIFCAILIQIVKNDELKFKEKISQFINTGLKTIGLFLLSFYVVAPNLFIEFGKVIQIIQYEARNTHLGADNLGWMGNLLFYVKSYYSFSNILAILFLLIGIFACWKLKDEKILLLMYGIFYWIIMSKLSLHWERWALPMYISPLFVISIGISYSNILFRVKRILKFIFYTLVTIILLHQFSQSISSSISLSFVDTRVVANEFCKKNGITLNNSIFEGYTPFNPSNPGVIFDFDSSKNTNYQYLILSSRMYERYFNEAERYQNEISFYQHIKQNYELIKEIDPTIIDPLSTQDSINNIIYYIKQKIGLKQPSKAFGPTIQIYKIKVYK